MSLGRLVMICFEPRMLVFIWVLLSTVPPAFGKADLCFPKTDSVTGSPGLDGSVEDDVGYTNATRVVLGRDSGTPYAGFVRIVEDRTEPFVHLALQVEGLASAFSGLAGGMDGPRRR